ncbi:MAG: hypothetical protein AYK18_18070 [Theionarchaea archaeon DG-70]|nr:MAG: hypothetical protein AYK18_18070 [Theionarchaea archaeon DG-70]
MNGDENPRKTRLSTILVLKDIFPENRLKEYLNDVEKKCEKDKDCNHIVYRDAQLTVGFIQSSLQHC